jgi:hypothetical protein
LRRERASKAGYAGHCLNKRWGPDPDPLVRGTDPRIRIRTKMSRILNTGLNLTKIDQIKKIEMYMGYTSRSLYCLKSFTLKTFQTYSIIVPVPENSSFLFTPLFPFSLAFAILLIYYQILCLFIVPYRVVP